MKFDLQWLEESEKAADSQAEGDCEPSSPLKHEAANPTP
jgi:hypothetical protein